MIIKGVENRALREGEHYVGHYSTLFIVTRQHINLSYNQFPKSVKAINESHYS
jgi:hypothetical protein